MAGGEVVAVHASALHGFSKQERQAIQLRTGLGVVGDAHAGTTVQHRSRVARNPAQPNLRQVHLIHVELFDLLADRGFAVRPGDLGENITTRGTDLLALPAGTRLRLGASAEIVLTGLRNPCVQIERFRCGLLAAVRDRNAAGGWIRKAGVMAVVTADGDVHPGDAMAVELPTPPHRPLEPV